MYGKCSKEAGIVLLFAAKASCSLFDAFTFNIDKVLHSRFHKFFMEFSLTVTRYGAISIMRTYGLSRAAAQTISLLWNWHHRTRKSVVYLFYSYKPLKISF